MTCKTDIDKYLNIINIMSVDIKKANNDKVSIDLVKKQIINYPAYGTIYANLIIPSIDLYYPVYHGDDLDIMMKGIGHYAGSFFPGENGSILLAAHNNVHFQRLYDVKLNDKIILETIYGTFTYEPYDFKVIDATDEDALPINQGEEILMMYTCYPRTAVGYASKRYVVYSKLVEANYEKVKSN